MTEVMAGRIDFFFGPLGVVLPHIKEGKLTALVVNGAARSSLLPNVPTTAEAGFVNAEYPLWLGVFLPAKTPRETVEKLHREALKALGYAKVKDKLAALGLDPLIMTPTEFDAYVEKEIAVNAALVKAAASRRTDDRQHCLTTGDCADRKRYGGSLLRYARTAHCMTGDVSLFLHFMGRCGVDRPRLKPKSRTAAAHCRRRSRPSHRAPARWPPDAPADRNPPCRTGSRCPSGCGRRHRPRSWRGAAPE